MVNEEIPTGFADETEPHDHVAEETPERPVDPGPPQVEDGSGQPAVRRMNEQEQESE